jgi:hypothetical protein
MGLRTARRTIKGRCFPLTPALSPSEGERGSRRLCAPELGKDAFHRVPDFAQNEWDAVERVLTIPEGRFLGREGCGASVSEWRFRGLFGIGFMAA